MAPGFEAALGAALGDDLTAAADEGAPRHWRDLGSNTGPALPAGAEPLSRHVQAQPCLARRLSQIGVVADEAMGRDLAGQLAQGQRLVSRAGALWRWDGFTIVAGAPTAAAVRLSQRNRQAVLAGEVATAEAAVQSADAAFAAGARSGTCSRGAR